MISPVHLATVGVADLQRAVRFYAAAFGYPERGRGEVGGGALERAWRMPRGLRGEAVVVGPEDADLGLIRLVRFSEPGERIWGAYERIQDLGHYALNMRVKDIGRGWDRLVAAGAQVKSEPRHWTVEENLSAWDSQVYDPDGVLLDVFQVEGDLEATVGEQDAEVSELQTVALHVGDMERSRAFYVGLGFGILYDKVVEGMEDFFHVPPGTALHNVNLLKRDQSRNGRIELAHYRGFPGSSLRHRAVPPNLGILSLTLRTEDLDAATRLASDLGGEPVAGPVEVDLPPLGRQRLATVLGPDGELLELCEPR
jgi:catechol 2,3-dioxygenase-like lactoylglutathione lyase family enzyme